LAAAAALSKARNDGRRRRQAEQQIWPHKSGLARTKLEPIELTQPHAQLGGAHDASQLVHLQAPISSWRTEESRATSDSAWIQLRCNGK